MVFVILEEEPMPNTYADDIKDATSIEGWKNFKYVIRNIL